MGRKIAIIRLVLGMIAWASVCAVGSAREGYSAHGEATLWTQTTSAGWEAGVRQVVVPRVEAILRIRPDDLFDPAIRVLLIKDLAPVQASLTAYANRISVRSTLLFGPVHVDFGRSWGEHPLRWGMVTASGSRWMALSAGWQSPGGLQAEILILVQASLRWEFSLFFRDGRVGWGVSACVS